MDEEAKRKLRELWDHCEKLSEEHGWHDQEAVEVLDSVMTKFEELFSKELNEE